MIRLPEKHKKQLIIALSLAMLVAIVYSPTFGGGVSWDEQAIFANGASEHYIEFFEYRFVRPMPNSLFGFERRLWGDASWPYHALNVFLHLLNAAAVYILGQRLMLSRRASLLAAALFALYPAATEAVSWIWGRPELLKTLFFNTSLIAYIAYRREGEWQALASSALFFLLALLSGQAAMALFVIVPLYEFTIADNDNRIRSLRVIAGFMAAVAIYLVLLPGRGELHPGLDFQLSRLFQMFSALGYYCSSLFLVQGQSLLPEFNGSTVYILTSMALPATTVLLFWDGRRLSGMLLLMSFLSLLPAAMVVMGDYKFPIGLRYLYMPLAPLCIVLAIAFERIKQDWIFITSASLLLVLMAGLTASRAMQWNSPESIWADAADKAAMESAAAINYAGAVLDAGKPDKARELVFRAFKMPNMDLGEFHKASIIYADAGGLGHVDEYLANVSRVRDEAKASYGIGYAYYHEYMTGNKKAEYLESALKHLSRSAELNPQLIEANYHLGVIYMDIGALDKARHYLEIVNAASSDGGGVYEIKSLIDRIDRADPSRRESNGRKPLGLSRPESTRN